MNRDAGDLREFFLHADFQFAGDVVDLGDGQASLHGAVAGGPDCALRVAHQEGSQRLPCGEKFSCV
jgi:hypothetical protein